MFESPSRLYSSEYDSLIFSQCPLVEDVYYEAYMCLGIDSKRPVIELVIAHLKCIIEFVCNKPNDTTIKFLDKSMKEVYSYIQTSHSKTSLQEMLHLETFIWQDGYFLSPSQVVGSWDHNCLPYLCQLTSANKHFSSFFGVQSEATLEMLVEVLHKIAKDHGTFPIPDKILEFVEFTSGQLEKKMHHEQQYLKIYLPDKDKIMRDTSVLADNVSTEWIKDSRMYKDFLSSEASYLVHTSIPWDRAIKLGVNPLLEAVLKDIEDQDFLNGTEFEENGDQSQGLCDQLNNILKCYPTDISILKEFVKDADDAQATEIIFVFDHRIDFPDSTLVNSSSRWKSLQHTPALCIFNNRKFTDTDIKGITKLGGGDKDKSAELIGRFGVGFNVAYHVTDCPSFVSYAEGGIPEYLCVFDPTQSFVHHATKQSPGKKWNFTDKNQYSEFLDQFQPYLHEDLHQLAQEVPNCLLDYKKHGYVGV